MEVSLKKFSEVSDDINTFDQNQNNQQQQAATTIATEPPAETTQPATEQATETQKPQEDNISSFSLGEEGEQQAAPTTTQVEQPKFNFEEELKKIDRKELLKKAGVNDFAIELDEYLAKGGKAQDYLNARAIDYTQISDEDLIKSDLKNQYPNLNRDEINRLYNRKYGITEEMLDDEKEDRLIQLKADGHLKRQSKIQEQQTFKIPDTPILQKDEAYELWRQQQEIQPQLMEQLRNYYDTHEATKALNESKRVAVNLGEGVSPFNFSIDRPELLTKMYTDGGETWQRLTSTKTGEPDVQKQQLIGLFAYNPQKFIQDIFTYGQKMGVRKELVEEGQNAQKPQAKVLSTEFNQGFQATGVGKFGDRAR